MLRLRKSSDRGHFNHGWLDTYHTFSFSEFEAGLRQAGMTDVSLTSTHTVADGMHSVIVKAAKPLP